MTAKQLKFAHGILSGKTGSDAYRLAYGARSNSKAMAERSCRLSKHPEVMAYIAQERAKTAAAFAWTREEMLETLKDIADKAEAPVDKTRAIAQASKMLGFDAPVKTETTGGLTIRWET
jgi:phage terminase small subunit